VLRQGRRDPAHALSNMGVGAEAASRIETSTALTDKTKRATATDAGRGHAHARKANMVLDSKNAHRRTSRGANICRKRKTRGKVRSFGFLWSR
jgi:hypothetical protein